MTDEDLMSGQPTMPSHPPTHPPTHPMRAPPPSPLQELLESPFDPSKSLPGSLQQKAYALSPLEALYYATQRQLMLIFKDPVLIRGRMVQVGQAAAAGGCRTPIPWGDPSRPAASTKPFCLEGLGHSKTLNP